MAKEKKTKQPKPDLQKIEIMGEEYLTILTNKYKNRKPYIPRNPKKIYSFIPGIIKDVFVSKGDEVKTGDKLLILEAMKMNNEILSPVNGKIKKVYVKKQQMVSKNELLVEIA